MFRKELKKQKYHKLKVNYIKGSTNDIDFNDFIDTETLCKDITSKRIRFENVEKEANGI